MSEVTIHIDALVVEGIDVPNAHRLGPAVAAELTRLVRERGLPTGPAPAAAGVELAAGLGAEAIGRRLAGAIYEGLRP